MNLNATYPSSRITLHLLTLAHRPSHWRFHVQGILRDLPESGIPGFVLAVVWLITWTLLLIP